MAYFGCSIQKAETCSRQIITRKCMKFECCACVDYVASELPNITQYTDLSIYGPLLRETAHLYILLYLNNLLPLFNLVKRECKAM